MRVKVLFFAVCREISGMRDTEVEVPEGATVADLLVSIGSEHPRLGEMARILMVSVNQEYAGQDTPLAEGDEVALIPPVSGGSGQADTYRIVTTPIVPEALHDLVRADEDGAVVTFAGVVRNHSQGRRTEYLEYEAYAPMAERQMREIGKAARSRWPVDQVAVLHRVGRLEIGETSVLIAVSSAHREEAFSACRFVLDELKARVPIWKKEVWDDGEAWVEGETGGVPTDRSA